LHSFFNVVIFVIQSQHINVFPLLMFRPTFAELWIDYDPTVFMGLG